MRKEENIHKKRNPRDIFKGSEKYSASFKLKKYNFQPSKKCSISGCPDKNRPQHPWCQYFCDYFTLLPSFYFRIHFPYKTFTKRKHLRYFEIEKWSAARPQDFPEILYYTWEMKKFHGDRICYMDALKDWKWWKFLRVINLFISR